jgi:hypothetical protein
MRFPIKESAVFELAEEVKAGLAAHPAVYPAPPVPAAELQAAIDAYLAARNQTIANKARYEESVRAKDDALATLKHGLKNDLRYAENTVDFDDALLKNLGWSGRKAKHRLQPPGQPGSLAAPKQGEGFLQFVWQKPTDGGKPVAYKIQRRFLHELDKTEKKDKNTGDAWSDIAAALETEISLQDQPRGVELEYRVLAINKAGEGPPSNTVMVVL